MPIVNIAVLALIIGAFAAFAGTLAWVTHRGAAPAARQVQRTPPLGAHHA